MRLLILILLVSNLANAQVKDDISVVQFSAEIVKTNEISLISFRDYNTETLYLSKNQKIFQKENITSLPTIILYNDGKEIVKIDTITQNALHQLKDEKKWFHTLMKT